MLLFIVRGVNQHQQITINRANLRRHKNSCTKSLKNSKFPLTLGWLCCMFTASIFYEEMPTGYSDGLFPFFLPIKPDTWMVNLIAMLFLIPLLRRKYDLTPETCTAVERERERFECEFEQEHVVRRLFSRPQGTLCFYTISIFWLGKNEFIKKSHVLIT